MLATLSHRLWAKYSPSTKVAGPYQPYQPQKLNKQVEIMSAILPLLTSMTNFQFSECHPLSFSVQRWAQSAHKGVFPQHPVNAGRTLHICLQ